MPIINFFRKNKRKNINHTSVKISGSLDRRIYNLISKKYPKKNFIQILLDAAACGDIAAVNWLVKKEIDIHHNNEEVLIIACVNNHPKIVEILLLHGANPTIQNSQALRESVKMGHSKIVKLLVTYWHFFDDVFEKLILHAVRYGYHKIVKILLIHNKKFLANGEDISVESLNKIYETCLQESTKLTNEKLDKVLSNFKKKSISKY